MTYTTGVQTWFERACPGEFKVVNDTLMMLKVRDGGTLYEDIETEQACYWLIPSPLKQEYYIEEESDVTFILETAQNADIFVFKGSDRDSATSIIEKGDKLYPGNPLRITSLDDLVIVFRKTVNGDSSYVGGVGDQYLTYDGSFDLSY